MVFILKTFLLIKNRIYAEHFISLAENFFLTVLGMDYRRVDELLHKGDITDYISICHLVKRPLESWGGNVCKPE